MFFFYVLCFFFIRKQCLEFINTGSPLPYQQMILPAMQNVNMPNFLIADVSKQSHMMKAILNLPKHVQKYLSKRVGNYMLTMDPKIGKLIKTEEDWKIQVAKKEMYVVAYWIHPEIWKQYEQTFIELELDEYGTKPAMLTFSNTPKPKDKYLHTYRDLRGEDLEELRELNIAGKEM